MSKRQNLHPGLRLVQGQAQSVLARAMPRELRERCLSFLGISVLLSDEWGPQRGLSRHPATEGCFPCLPQAVMPSFLSVLSEGEEKAQGAAECCRPQHHGERFVYSFHPVPGVWLLFNKGLVAGRVIKQPMMYFIFTGEEAAELNQIQTMWK